MHRLRSVYRDSFMGNQAGNSSVGYLALAVMVGLAGISSLTAFGNASSLTIADKAASASSALPDVGANANAAQEAFLETEAGAAANGGAQIGPSEAPEPSTADSNVGTASYGAQQHHGSKLWRGVGKVALGVTGAMIAKGLLRSAFTGIGTAVAPYAAFGLVGATAVLGFDAWHDIHPGSFHAVTNWVKDSFIGDAARWVSDSFVGDAFRWVTGDHFIGNTLTGIVGGAWNAFSTVITGAVSGAMAVGETALNALKTASTFVYDKTQVDRLFGDEFSDYRGLWSYPVASMFWNGAVDAAEDTWRYIKRIARFNRPDTAKHAAKITDVERSEVETEGTPVANDESWPYRMQVGDRTTNIESVLTELGIDPKKADFDGSATLTFENENGEMDVLGVFIKGNDTDGYRVDAVVEHAGSEEPESVFAYQMTAEELEQYGSNLAFAAAEQAGLDFNNYKETSMQQVYDQVEPGKSQTFAALTMDGEDIEIQGAQVDIEKLENNAVPMTSSYWRFSIVEDPMAETPADGESVDAVFELVEAEASTSIVEVAPTESSSASQQAQSAPSTSSNVPR